MQGKHYIIFRFFLKEGWMNFFKEKGTYFTMKYMYVGKKIDEIFSAQSFLFL